MTLNPEALDRYITGNYGEDQFGSDMDGCGELLRDGYCVLDPEHRGRHTTVGFYCDLCGKMRRGSTPAAQLRDANGEVDVEACWFCVNVLGPAEEERIVNA